MVQQTIALTGRGGRLGQFIAPHLTGLGYGLKNLRDHAPEGLACQDFTSFLSGCQGLVHAAFAHVPGKYRGGEGADPQGFWDLNHGATSRLLVQARAAGLRRVILFSSRAVYAPDQDLPAGAVAEDWPAIPDTLYGKLKLASETLAREHSDAAMQVIALRPTGVYGGASSVNKWTPLIQAALRGEGPRVNRTSTEVAGDTVAQAVALALDARIAAPRGEVWNLSDVRINLGEVLALAGFAGLSLPKPEALRGPELSSGRLQALGLRFPGRAGLEQHVRALRAEIHDDTA